MSTASDMLIDLLDSYIQDPYSAYYDGEGNVFEEMFIYEESE